MDQVVSKIKKGLNEGTTKIDMTKGIGNQLSKSLGTFKEEYNKFLRLTSNNELKFADTKEAIHSGEQMIKIFKELERVIGNFDDLTIVDAKKLFPQAFNQRIGDLYKQLGGLKTLLDNLSVKELDMKNAEKKLRELRTEGELLQQSLEEGIKLEIDTSSFDQALEKAQKKVEKLLETLHQEL